MAKAKRKTATKVKPKADGKVIEQSEVQRYATPTTPGTFTPEKEDEFLRLYETGITVFKAASAIGLSASTIFRRRRMDPEFSKRFDEAREVNLDNLEDILQQQAINGNTIAIFGLLKAFRPQRWRENVNVTGQVQHKHEYTLAIARVMRMEVGITQDKQEG